MNTPQRPETGRNPNHGQRQDLSFVSFICNVLFVLGTLLVVFAAFRNTLTW